MPLKVIPNVCARGHYAIHSVFYFVSYVRDFKRLSDICNYMYHYSLPISLKTCQL